MATSSHQPQTKECTELANHTVVPMFVAVINDKQNGWGIALPHVEFACNSSVNKHRVSTKGDPHRMLSAASALVFYHRTVGGHQSLDRDRLECGNLPVDGQRREYAPIRETTSLTVPRVERYVSALLAAITNLLLG